MHEFALGSALVQSVLQEIAKQPSAAKLLRARVVIGELRQVVPDYLEQAYQTLTRQSPADGSRLEIRRIPIRLECACGWQGLIATPPFWCPECGSEQVKLINGMECFLESLEFEVPDADGN